LGDPLQQQSLITRFQKWVAVAIAFCVILYLVFSVWSGFEDIQEELSSFKWPMFVYAILLTFCNYILRFIKWHYLLKRLNVPMPLGVDIWNFIAGLSMAISPGKAGELLKPYVVREITKVPMARTIPALVTERLTDGIAMLLLATVGVTTYAGNQIMYLIIPAILTVIGIIILSNEKLSLFFLNLLRPIPILGKVIPKIEEMMQSMRTCVAPISLLWTVFLSFFAWGAECVAYLLIFLGLGVAAPLDICCFLYSFATVAGSAMPGGLGVADGALIGGAMQFIPDITQSQAVTAAILTRIATLWLGVGIGALALLKISNILGKDISIQQQEPETESV
jgi:glycosyltransferase 2 family protein